MAADERPEAAPDPLEARLRRRLRAVGFVAILSVLLVMALADTFGGSLDLHAGPFVFGTLAGVLLVLVGVEAGARLLGKP